MFRPPHPQPSLSRRLLLPALAGLTLANLPAVILPVVIMGAAPSAMAQNVTIEIGQFEPALSPYGRWFDHPAYGRIWQPVGIGPDWAPYTDGYWAYMDDDTWLWVANEPWGWAPYHYGRWLFVDPIGWVWRPGRVWAPAWVVWRFGGGYYGWAPAPFDDDWDERRFRGSNWGNRVPAQQWIFVRAGAFTHHHIREVMVPRHSNRRLFDETQDITRTGHRRQDNADGHDRQTDDDAGGGRRHPDVVIQGPRERDIRRETGRPIPPARVVDSDAPGPTTRTGNEVRLYRPDHRDHNDERQPGRQTREQPGGGAVNPDQPDGGRPDGGRPDGGQPRRPEADPSAGEAKPGHHKPGKPDQPAAQPQDGDRRSGSMAPLEPIPPTRPSAPEVMAPDMPDANQPEVRRPDVIRPEVRKPEVRQPEHRQPDIRQPDVRQPDVRQPEWNQQPEPRSQRQMPDMPPDMPAPPTHQRRPPESQVVPLQQQAPRERSNPSGPGPGFQPQGQYQRQPQEMQPQRQQPQRQEQPRQQGQQGRPHKGGKPGEVPPQGDGGN